MKRVDENQKQSDKKACNVRQEQEDEDTEQNNNEDNDDASLKINIQHYLEQLKKKVETQIKNPFSLPFINFTFQELHSWKNNVLQLDATSKLYAMRVDHLHQGVVQIVNSVIAKETSTLIQEHHHNQPNPTNPSVTILNAFLEDPSKISINHESTLQTTVNIVGLWRQICKKCDNLNQILLNTIPLQNNLMIDVINSVEHSLELNSKHPAHPTNYQSQSIDLLQNQSQLHVQAEELVINKMLKGGKLPNQQHLEIFSDISQFKESWMHLMSVGKHQKITKNNITLSNHQISQNIVDTNQENHDIFNNFNSLQNYSYQNSWETFDFYKQNHPDSAEISRSNTKQLQYEDNPHLIQNFNPENHQMNEHLRNDMLETQTTLTTIPQESQDSWEQYQPALDQQFFKIKIIPNQKKRSKRPRTVRKRTEDIQQDFQFIVNHLYEDQSLVFHPKNMLDNHQNNLVMKDFTRYFPRYNLFRPKKYKIRDVMREKKHCQERSRKMQNTNEYQPENINENDALFQENYFIECTQNSLALKPIEKNSKMQTTFKREEKFSLKALKSLIKDEIMEESAKNLILKDMSIFKEDSALNIFTAILHIAAEEGLYLKWKNNDLVIVK